MLIGLLLGSTISSVHQTEEDCLGRAAIIKQELSKAGGVIVECKQLGSSNSLTLGGGIQFDHVQ